MNIDKIRIYAEVLEQGLDFKEYIIKNGFRGNVENIYTKKSKIGFKPTDTLVDRIRKVKDIDVLITAISDECEYPILLVEYSTAVPTDDHKMQRCDVYYWSSVFKTPMMKISPVSKGMKKAFGGGSKFCDDLEIALACKQNAVFYPIHWETETGKDVLKVKENALSCILHNDEISAILKMLMQCFVKAESFCEYYEKLLNRYKHEAQGIIREYTNEKMRNVLTNSTRFQWTEDKLNIKINRFGHAMDPERGVLFFANMLVGAKNITSEIQVNRSPVYDIEGGYSTLFNRLSREPVLKDYVQKIIDKKNNVFDDKDALYVFCTALGIDNSLCFKKLSAHSYYIKDDVLLKFLINHPSITAKSIFFLSTELRLTDKDRNLICVIRWNEDVTLEFIKSISSINYEPTQIKDLSLGEAKEDIVTFASVELYKKLNFNLVAVSYPGAQGDRCILQGSGRKVLRTYIDVIAYEETSDGICVYLQESKDFIAKSKKDVEKLLEVKNNDDKFSGLKVLFEKIIGDDNITSLYTSVAAKKPRVLPNLDVDYIFMFDIDNTEEANTIINYSVAVINTNLVEKFKPLIDDDGKLKGFLKIDKIYSIK